MAISSPRDSNFIPAIVGTSSVDGTPVLPWVDPTTHRLLVDLSSGVAWGAITGTLANQTDLQNALNAKVPTTRSLTINGTAQDLSLDRTWTITNITGNAGTVTNATLTTALTVNGGTLTLTASALNTSVLTIGAGAVSVSGSNTGDNAANSSTMYIGTTAVALNRTSGALVLTGITSIDGSSASCTGNSASATYASAATIVDDTTTNATMYPLWATANTGNLPLKVSSTKLSFNPSTGTLTATTFSGALSGNATTATTATNATNLTTTDDTTTNATYYPAFQTATGGTNPLKTSSTKLTYNPSTGTLSATTFVGALTGTASGNLVSGGALGTPSSGTLTNCTFPTLNQNTTGSAASLSISGQTGLLTFTGLTTINRVKTIRDAADTILELGGSYTPTGTWTSMTLITPALGTPASGVLTNCTGLPVAGGGTGLATATAYAVLCGGTTGTGAFQSIASVGTAGQVLTSNGAGALPTFQAAAGGGAPRIHWTTTMENEAASGVLGNRWDTSAGGTGTANFSGVGLTLSTGATSGSFKNVTQGMSGNSTSFNVWDFNPAITYTFKIFASGNNGKFYVRASLVGTSTANPIYTVNQMGFKGVLTGGGAFVVSATNGNGTTETATDISVNYTDNQFTLVTAHKTSTTNIKYYLNGILRATHTTNLPATISSGFYWCDIFRENDVAVDESINVYSCDFSKDAF